MQVELYLQTFLSRLIRITRIRPWLSIVAGSFLLLVFAPAILYLGISIGLLGNLPDSEEYLTHKNLEAARIYSIDGVLLGTYHIENRTSVPLDSIPQHLIDALLATEDHRFYDHNGVDIPSLFRVMFRTILLMDESSGGGSTISQQLAKAWYPRPARRGPAFLLTKLSEMAIARDMEKQFSKDELLELYLNSVSFGEEIFGIQAASLRYFSKPCTQLSLSESAMLVGMLKAPSRFHPVHHPREATQRRNVVLSQMKKRGLIDQEEFARQLMRPIHPVYNKKSHHEGLAPHVREYLRQELTDWCMTYNQTHEQPIDLYRSGLSITLSIHSRMQTYAEAAVRDHMKILQQKFDQHWSGRNKTRAAGGLIGEKIAQCPRVIAWKAAGISSDSIDVLLRTIKTLPGFSWKPNPDSVSVLDSVILDAYTLQTGLLVLDPTNGHVRAWVGGIDHRYSAFDQVRAARQTGSVFKPILYATALETGEDPCGYISNEREEYEDYQNWNPRNADNYYGGLYSMEGALTHSVNVVSARLIMKIGIQPVIDLAHQLGIARSLPHYPSIALGAADISLQEMVTAFSTFANEGKLVAPRLILRIEDRQGHILGNYSSPDPGTRVLQQDHARMITHMLEAVVNKGTARALRVRNKLKMDLAGKTGTTQRQQDGWFIGYHPGLVVGARVGAQDPRIHWRSLAAGQGASTALPIVGSFLQAVCNDQEFAYLEKQHFSPLSEDIQEALDCADYTFPMGMSEFKRWWKARNTADSLTRLGLEVPDSIRIQLQSDWPVE